VQASGKSKNNAAATFKKLDLSWQYANIKSPSGQYQNSVFIPKMC
jgi:hypothetical protein